MRIKCVFLILAVSFVSGCTSVQPSSARDVVLAMDANPAVVFSGGIATISVDIENRGAKPVSGVNVDVFEKGSMDFVDNGKCAKDFGVLVPEDFRTFACNLKARSVESDTDSTVWVRARYKSTLSSVQTTEIISQPEMETRKRAGKFSEGQKTFSFHDSNLEATMELSESPFVDARGKTGFVLFKIRNIGNGFIEKLNGKDIHIESSKKYNGKDIISCPKDDIFISGNEFPRFSCSVNLNGDVSSFETVRISMGIDYSYEIRDSINVGIAKGGSIGETKTPAPAPETKFPLTNQYFQRALDEKENDYEKGAINAECTRGTDCVSPLDGKGVCVKEGVIGLNWICSGNKWDKCDADDIGDTVDISGITYTCNGEAWTA